VPASPVSSVVAGAAEGGGTPEPVLVASPASPGVFASEGIFAFSSFVASGALAVVVAGGAE
jgi:hypothetical protein